MTITKIIFLTNFFVEKTYEIEQGCLKSKKTLYFSRFIKQPKVS
jgi:hypothetical protein